MIISPSRQIFSNIRIFFMHGEMILRHFNESLESVFRAANRPWVLLGSVSTNFCFCLRPRIRDRIGTTTINDQRGSFAASSDVDSSSVLRKLAKKASKVGGFLTVQPLTITNERLWRSDNVIGGPAMAYLLSIPPIISSDFLVLRMMDTLCLDFRS
jgi:hypothetical protein